MKPKRRAARPDTWMPLYIGDYLADTMHLTARQHGAYLLLIMAMWRSNGVLPHDDTVMMTAARLSKPEWRQDRPVIMAFFQDSPDGWRQKRVVEELERAATITDARSEAGATGAERKWGASLDRQNAASRSQRLTAARAKGSHTKQEWMALLEIFGQCVRCGATDGNLVKDHIEPIYQGGSDAIENLQPLCLSCNSSKGPEAVDHRHNVYQDWRERLAKRLANASQTPRPSPPPSQSQESHTTQPPSPEPRASALGDGAKWGAACKAIIRERWPNVAKVEMMGTGLASQWIANGYDLEADVLPIVRQLVSDKRGDPITTLSYFADAIGRRYAERTVPCGEADPDGEVKVRTMLESLYAKAGRWDEAWNWREQWGARPDRRQAAA